MKRLLITGGAGFVGSSLALALKARHPGWVVTSFDNLHRRGSELTLARLKEAGVHFVHGDVRVSSDVASLEPADVLIDCSAEPSVLAGVGGSPAYVLQTNLVGTLECLEYARRCGAALVFLSTSRVYPVAPLRALPLVPGGMRLELDPARALPPGLTREGLTEAFTLEGARTLYGATKLASELLITEYVDTYGLRAWINRCGVLAGPWQMGKVDQGVITHWALSHVLGRPLSYLGYGGKQVRDVLHVDDLAALLDLQLARLAEARGQLFNVGGGVAGSCSLLELSDLCSRAVGKGVAMQTVDEVRANDIPWYCTDTSKVRSAFGWAPTHSMTAIVEDVTRWVQQHRDALVAALG